MFVFLFRSMLKLAKGMSERKKSLLDLKEKYIKNPSLELGEQIKSLEKEVADDNDFIRNFNE